MVMNVHQTYCGDHFAIYTTIKLCHTLETNILYISNISKNQKVFSYIALDLVFLWVVIYNTSKGSNF